MNFNKAITDLNGKPIKERLEDGTEVELTMGKALAPMLAGARKGDALKMFNWALKLHNGEEVELDESDKETLRAFIKADESITNLFEAQLLLALKD